MKAYKRYLTLFGIGFLVIHFTAMTLYTLPEEDVHPRLKLYSSKYLLPMFHIKFNMFVPAPKVNSSLYIRYKNPSGELSEWIDPSAEYKKKHYRYRVSYHGRMALAISNLLYHTYGEYRFFQEKVSDMEFNEYIKQRDTYYGLERLLKAIFNHEGKPLPSEIEVKIIHQELTEPYTGKYNEVEVLYPFIIYDK